jgi:hypothetical protein
MNYNETRRELFTPSPTEIYIHGTSSQRLLCIPFLTAEAVDYPFLTEEERQRRRVRQGWVRA